MSARQERIINMIDALLGEEGEEGKEEMLHCSLDSIDRLGDSHSLPPSLQFEKESWKAAVESSCNLSYPGCWITEQSPVFSHSSKSVSTITASHSITPFQSVAKIPGRN